MKKLSLFSGLLVLFVYCNLTLQAQEILSSPDPEYPLSDWKETIFLSEGFAISLPVKPYETSERYETDSGILIVKTRQVLTRNGRYQVVATTFPDKEFDAQKIKMYFDKTQQGLVRKYKGKLDRVEDYKKEDVLSREIRILADEEKRIIRARLFYKSDRSWMILSDTTNQEASIKEPELFHNSLRLVRLEKDIRSQVAPSTADETTQNKRNDVVSKKTEPSSCQSIEKTKAGKVKVEVTISEQGNVIAAEAVDGPRYLYKCAEDTLRQWKFKPVLKDGAAVRVQGFMTVKFEGN